MPQPTNKISNFWQELKRRKVIRVITVYAAAAFVILELVDIVAPSLRLPDWTLNFIIVLLCVGFIIAVILSWIFDVTPEGIEKTKPSKEVRKDEKSVTPNSWKIATYVSVVIIIGLVGYHILSNNRSSRDIRKLEKTIAVLPFENWHSDEEFPHLGDAIANEINTQLAKINQFHVFSFTSSSKFKGPDKPSIPQIGRELGANFIIEGSVERQDQDVSIHVQVIQAHSDNHLWANEFKGKWKDLFTIRAEIAINIAEKLKTVLSPEELKQIEKNPTENLEAYNLYLLGKFHFYRYTEESIKKSIQYYQNAIQLDSTLALAYAGLARSFQVLVSHYRIPRDQGYMQAKKAVLKAIELDRSLGEAYVIHGLITFFLEWEIDNAEKLFQKAISLNPNSSDIYNSYAQYLNWIGNYDLAISMARHAIELDPLTTLHSGFLGAIHYYAGRYDESIDHLIKLLQQDSNLHYINAYLAYNYTLKGLYPKAIGYADKTMSIIGDPGNDHLLSGYIGWVYARSKKTNKAKQILSQLEELYYNGQKIVDPFSIAVIYAGLDEKEKAIDWLIRSYDARSGLLVTLNAYSNNFFKNISSDPRYIELLEKIGFKVN